MKTGRSLVNLATELERQLAHRKDLIVPSQRMRFETHDAVSSVAIEESGGAHRYGITELASRQLAEKLKIPYAYFQRMKQEQPALLDQNVNTWLQKGEGGSRLIRILDQQVRAVLSERYRRLDNWDLAEQVLPILQGLPEARLESVELTDIKMYLKVVTPRVAFEIAPGDVVQAGVVVMNSEVGMGSLSVQPLLFRLVCKNGLIASDSALRKTHLGKTIESGEDAAMVFQNDTLRADDAAFFLKVRDVVQAAVTEVSFRLVAEKLQRTMGITISGDPVKAVELLSNRYAFNHDEQSGVLRHLILGGELSAYGLVNAVTGFSQEVANYDRATDLEMIGGKMIELPLSEWKTLLEAV